MKKTILILYFFNASLLVFIPFIIAYLRPHFKIEYKNIKTLKKDIFLKYDCVIPTDVPSTSFYNNHTQSIFRVKNKHIYYVLDNKNKASKLVRKYNMISHIPTLHKLTNKALKNFVNKTGAKKYIFKSFRGSGSFEQHIFNRNYLKNVRIKNYKNYIVQPYIDNYYVYSYDAVVNNGVIKSDFFSKILKKNGITFTDFFTHIRCKVLDNKNIYYEKIKNFSTNLLRDINYSGIIEIEFIITRGNIYFLEINPRMCGHVSQLDKNYKSVYFNKIIIPYLKMFNIVIPKHNIVSNYISGTNPSITLFFLFRNYKITITLICILLFIYLKS